MTTYEENSLAQRLQIARHRSQELYRQASDIPWQEPEFIIRCLQELKAALAELHEAEEELCQQNDMLVQTQHTLEDERRRYQELFEFAPDAYFVTTIQGGIQEANQVAATLLQASHPQLQGKLLMNFVPESRRRLFRTMLNQLPSISRLEDWELRLRRQDGVCFNAAITVEAVRNAGGEVTALRWMVRDITARRHAEAELRTVQLQNLQLIESDRLKNEFLATLSHELRTPLTAIIGFSELLLRQSRMGEVQTAAILDCILRNSHQLLALIEDLLDFSKLQSAPLQLHPEPFDLVELAHSIATDLRPLAERKALSLHSPSHPHPLVIVNDRHRLRQVLANLVANGIKFTDLGSVAVEILELPENRVAIAVRDTGIGIDPTHHKQVFQAFWQVDQSSSRQYGGTGLGLAIVSALVKSMRGGISLQSQVGMGSVFRVELPRHL